MSVYLTEEIEDKTFSHLYKEMKKPPSKVLQNIPENTEQKPRNLIRTFFKPKKIKEDKYQNTVEESAYNDLF